MQQTTVTVAERGEGVPAAPASPADHAGVGGGVDTPTPIPAEKTWSGITGGNGMLNTSQARGGARGMDGAGASPRHHQQQPGGISPRRGEPGSPSPRPRRRRGSPRQTDFPPHRDASGPSDVF